jgi:ribosomal protein S18 acetylase RimI-like enzyme
MVAGHLGYTIAKIPSYPKHYPLDELDASSYVDQPEKAIFFALVDGMLAGQIILRKNWNQFAYIEDIVVDARFRRRGVGTVLLRRAAEWARGLNLPGVMLETQNINVAACKLYARCGFQLAGFDRLLYLGLQPGTEEIALYWYLVF